MKKLMMPGIALCISLVFGVGVSADSVNNGAESASAQRTINDPSETELRSTSNSPQMDLRGSSEPYQGRGDNSEAGGLPLGARWVGTIAIDGHKGGNIEVMVFNNTFALQKAVSILGDSGASLSCVQFGRIPFQQMLTIAPFAQSNSFNQNTNPVASLPEPATLTLLGTGLAALAAGLRKRKKNSHK